MATTRKRQRSTFSPVAEDRDLDVTTDSSDEDDPWPVSAPKRVKTRSLSHVFAGDLSFPRSAYQGYMPPMPPISERNALQTLGTGFAQGYDSERPEYTYVDLDNFSIYRGDYKGHEYEMTALDCLRVRRGLDELVFDGFLSVNNQRVYVEGVQFGILAVDGYGDLDAAHVEGRLSIQSTLAATNYVWYKLGQPSSAYQRFYEPFRWLADFTNYFISYLLVTNDVMLADFRTNFFTWLNPKHSGQELYEKWHLDCNKMRDFRTTVVSNIEFLWKECHSIDDSETGLMLHPVWNACYDLQGIDEQPVIEAKTIVTPFVYQCFKGMYFHRHLEPRMISDQGVLGELRWQKARLNLTLFRGPDESSGIYTPQSRPDDVDDLHEEIGAGDCVSIYTDGIGWHSPRSYAYVQGVRTERGRTKLDIIWLYSPEDTTVGTAYYPFDNELFFSDHCQCGNNAIDLDCVASKVSVTFFTRDPSSVNGLCVRQKFRTEDDDDTYDFVSITHADFTCDCNQSISDFEMCRRDYQIGDAVLVQVHKDVLEPAQITDFDLDTKRILLRRLPRNTSAGTRPNELLLTEEVLCKPAKRIVRRINVRFFKPETIANHLPDPYNRDGTGDFYFISGSAPDAEGDDHGDQQADADADVESTSTGCSTFPPITQGLRPIELQTSQKLRGMGIFCGGGNFDRGLSDGGSVDFKYAVDLDRQAIYSYAANFKEEEETELFFGSVNDYLAQAMGGSQNRAIARPSSIDFLSGGSPCPGFSPMQNNKQSDSSLRNCSLVASFVSFVDVYSPAYCVLENVASMTLGHGPEKKENVFAQILAALVAMGYQVQQFLMDAWNYGSSQGRTRVFIVASAPGLEPVPRPAHTHSHPRFCQRSLGKSGNGKPFGKRQNHRTPFEHVSPSSTTSDLPNIGDSLPQLCPAFPDHKLVTVDAIKVRNRYAAVPSHPIGMGFSQAGKKGLLSGDPLEFYRSRGNNIGHSYTRIKPNGLFPTVVTKLMPRCNKNGKCLHWSQDRPMTVMEMRRAQGFLDHEVIVGTTSEKSRIIGNSVERNVSFVLGLAIRESWETSSDVTRSRVLGQTARAVDRDEYDTVGNGVDGIFLADDRVAQLQTPDRSEDQDKGL